MYHYPLDDLRCFSDLITITPDVHTMGESLMRYIEMKMHPLLNECDYSRIVVRGRFERAYGISDKEKKGKLFNYMRPTATLEDSVMYINCFPGIDYVFHYGNIIKTYLLLTNREVEVMHSIPSEKECWDAIIHSELQSIPKVHTVIMGYVEGLQWISDDASWKGKGNFLWKRVCMSTCEGILLGCKHTYWGEIAGRIVSYLAAKGVKRVIYSGKLGTLNAGVVPNMMIATGDSSILPNGEKISWNNIFENAIGGQVYSGTHITVPSVLQETKKWVNEYKGIADFVDPEIGHMALAAYKNKIEFSYFHIISDNLSEKYDFDLSNERKLEVIEDRRKLCNRIGTVIKTL